MKYEYVTKKEYGPVRQKLERIIKRVQKIMDEEEDIQFYYQLIGSGNRHLITRLVNGNKGFDFDYNIVIETPDEFKWNAKEVKLAFIRAINRVLKGTEYKPAEDSTSAITIKVVDAVNKKIVHSCDFGIIYYISDDFNDGYKYIRNNKNGRYTFEARKVSTNLDYKIDEIENYYNNGWEVIKEEYLDVKSSNKLKEKHSFVLYLESVNNVYNHIQQEKRKVGGMY